MLSYITIGTNDYDRALAFYDNLFTLLGGERSFPAPTGQFFGFGDGTLFGVFRPENGQAASGGNGTMFAFKVSSPDEVHDVHAKAIAFGASDEGEPGPRGDRGFYGAYFRDPDGNKLCVYHM